MTGKHFIAHDGTKTKKLAQRGNTACIEQRDKGEAGCGQDVQGKLRKGDTSFNRVSYRFVIALHTLQVNT